MFLRTFPLEIRHQARDDAAELGFREPLAGAALGTLEEGEHAEEVGCAAVLVERAAGTWGWWWRCVGTCLLGWWWVDPAVWVEDVGGVAPNGDAAAHGVGRDGDVGAALDDVAGDGGGADGFAEGDGKGRFETHHLVKDGVEEGHLFVFGFGDVAVGGGEAEVSEFVAEGGLEGGVLG